MKIMLWVTFESTSFKVKLCSSIPKEEWNQRAVWARERKVFKVLDLLFTAERGFPWYEAIPTDFSKDSI